MQSIILETVKGPEEEVPFDVYSRLIQNRIIFINDIVSDKNAADIMAILIHLDSVEESKITVFINSEGGDLRNIFMIYDTMRLLKSPIETFCAGSVMRESVLLLAAGTKGMRFISKNSDVNVSQITHTGVLFSDLTNAKISHDKNQKDNLAFMQELATCMGTTRDKLMKQTERQLFLNPAEAVKLGVADKVV